MATHWTACTPRENKRERSDIFNDQEWFKLYEEAEKLVHTRNNVFTESVRQNAILKTLKYYPKYADLIMPLPLAVEKLNNKPFLLKWTGADTVLGEGIVKRINDNNDHQIKILVRQFKHNDS